VVHIISEWTSATRPHSINHFISFDGVRSSATIGPRADPFSALRRRPAGASPAPSLIQLTPHAYADTLTTCKYTARVVQRIPRPVHSSHGCLLVSTRSRPGWRRTDSKSTRQRPMSSGAHQVGVNTRFHRSHALTVGTTSFSPVASVRASEYTLTPILPFGPTSTLSSRRVSMRYVRSGASGVAYLRRHTLTTLIHSLVITKADCSSLLAGVSSQLLSRLQSVFNAAALMIYSSRRSEHITPLLRELHWLKVPQRIQY